MSEAIVGRLLERDMNTLEKAVLDFVDLPIPPRAMNLKTTIRDAMVCPGSKRDAAK